jgi:ketosteroid isomerase-like protein
MTKENSKAIESVRATLDDLAKALRTKNAGAALSHYAADNVQFLLEPPLQFAGANALKEKDLEAWFETWNGEIGLEFRDLKITVREDLAICYGLSHLSGKKKDGEEADVWFRTTFCLRKVIEKWKIIHQHESVPFYMDGSFKAAVDLKP